MGEFIEEYAKTLSDLPEIKFEIVFDDTGKEVRKLVPPDLLLLDRTIVEFVEKHSPGLYVENVDDLVYGFCHEYPMYRGSTVKARVEKLSSRGYRL